MIKRKKYLDTLEAFVDNVEFIKVITGMRRTGKSTLMNQIVEGLIERGITDEKIIKINFESLQYEHLRNYRKLYEYVLDKVKTRELHYIFIDEIQYVQEFEKVINSLKVDLNVSIFITGSNSNLLSGELATLLAGRYIEVKVYPLTFNEWLEINDNKEPTDDDVNSFLKYGSLPQIQGLDNKNKRYVLEEILNQIIYKDIIARVSVRNEMLLKSLINYIINNSSKIISIKSITDYLNSNGHKTKDNTISDYLTGIINSMLVYECRKYNIKGKVLLKKSNKLYVNDLGLKYSVLNEDHNPNYGDSVETVIYNHLKSIGYEITFGQFGEYEIDFIAIRNTENGFEKKYIQASYMISENKKAIDREFRPLELVKDNHEKYLITLDKNDLTRNGIKHINLKEFLMNDDF